MNRGRICTIIVCYCLVTITVALFSVVSFPASVCAEGTEGTPPLNPPNPPADSTLNAASTLPPGEAEARQGSDPAFDEAVDLLAQLAFTLKM